jgi:hypothetical protein
MSICVTVTPETLYSFPIGTRVVFREPDGRNLPGLVCDFGSNESCPAFLEVDIPGEPPRLVTEFVDRGMGAHLLPEPI